MSVASIPSRALLGIEALEVTVEVHLSPGLPSFAIVGLPETAVKESKERVRSALLNSGFDFPSQRLTVNLAPADLPKAGGRYDLAIALAILVASEQLAPFGTALTAIEMLGELALDGTLRPVPGVVQAVLAARAARRAIVVPAANRQELLLVDYSLAFGAATLAQFVETATTLNDESETLSAAFAPLCPEQPNPDTHANQTTCEPSAYYKTTTHKKANPVKSWPLGFLTSHRTESILLVLQY